MAKENFENERILNAEISNEMRKAYLDFAMSVIVSRAIPSIEDGLKPVQRRILYSMHLMGLKPNSQTKKCARIVGDVIGKFHPHGDAAVYDALVRMAQDFSLRYPLVDGQGNFGSIDGDSAAAMRYTEARLTKIAEEVLQDLEKDTVDWADNYDSSRKEPMFLPTKVPALLCNGTMGIAVWMATNMPPHNLTEIINALIACVKNADITHEEIMEHISWPDFPTGWMIFDKQKINEIYRTWRGSITVRWKVHIENDNWNKIIIDQLPYQVNKSTLVWRIWELAGEWKFQWAKNIIDESNKWKIRISIELKPWVDPQAMLIKLFKLTDLQTTFPVNNIVLIENGMQPNLLWIKAILQEFITFRQTVVYRRSMYLLNKAKARLHILEWLQKAIDIIDEVIALIRWSKTREDAKQWLMKQFEFSEQQAEYILMLRLQTLVWLEIEKILNEIDDKKLDIDYLTGLVTDKEKLNIVVIDELEYIKSEYGDDRKTELSEDLSVYNLDKAMRDLKKNEDFLKEDVLLWRSVDDNVKVVYQTRITSLPTDTYKVYNTNNQNKIFVVTENWDFINPRIKDLPSTNVKWPAVSWKDLGVKDKIVFLEITDEIKQYLLIVTNKNTIKKIDKEILFKMRRWWNVMKLQPWEKVMKVISVNEWDYIGLITKNWLWTIYNSNEVRSMGRLSGWITAMMLEDGDEIVDMFNYHKNLYLAMFSDKWNAKAILTEDLKIRRKGRWKAGFIYTLLEKWENIIWWLNLDEWDIKILLADGQIRTFDVDKVPLLATNKKMKKVVWWKIKRILI